MIIFDFDGVLADSLEQHLGAYTKVFQLFGREFHLKSPEDWRNSYKSAWEQNYFDGGFSEEEMRQAISKYFDFVDYSKVNLFAGVTELIPKLAEKYPLAIASSTNSQFIEEKLRAENLLDAFGLILGSSETSDKLNKLEKIFAHFNADKERAVYVGDTSADVKAGKAFGIGTIGVSYGWYGEERIAAEAPSAIAHNVEQVGKSLEILINQSS